MGLSLVNLLLVLLAAWISGNIAKRFGYPEVLGELAAGIIFGPALLGILQEGEGIKILAEVGVFLMMFYIGMEVDHGELRKSSRAGILAAIGGFIVPFVLGYGAVIVFGGSNAEAVFVAIAVSVTSLATKSRILVDLKLIGTRIANVLISGALFSDTAAIIIFAAVVGIFESGGLEITNLLLISGKALLFFIVVIFIGLKVFPYLGRKLAETGFTNRTGNFTLLLLVAFTFGEFAELAGLHSIIGAFMAGLFIHKDLLTPRITHDLTALVQDVSIGFLAPIFFVMAGFHVSLGVFQTDLPFMITIIALATLGKIFGTAIFYLPTGYGWREGLTVGAGMNGRGAVEIIIAEIALNMGLISTEIFSILVFMAFFTTATVPVLLKWCVSWLQRRDELVHADETRNGIMIIGAGPIARKLAHELSTDYPVWLIDSNRQLCDQAFGEGLKVIHGNALHEDALEKGDVSSARIVIALTNNPEINVLSSQIVREMYLVPEVYVLLSPNQQKVFKNVLENTKLKPFDMGDFKIAEWDWLIAHNRVREEVIKVKENKKKEEFLNDVKKYFFPVLVRHNGKTKFFYSVESLYEGDDVHGLYITDSTNPVS